jgi:hypothetical protein
LRKIAPFDALVNIKGIGCFPWFCLTLRLSMRLNGWSRCEQGGHVHDEGFRAHVTMLRADVVMGKGFVGFPAEWMKHFSLAALAWAGGKNG